MVSRAPWRVFGGSLGVFAGSLGGPLGILGCPWGVLGGPSGSLGGQGFQNIAKMVESGAEIVLKLS